MAVLKAYFDDSGDQDDPQNLSASLGGYVGIVDNWQYFEKEWKKALHDHGVPYLHMKEFAHFKGPFQKYETDDKGRIALLKSLIKVITNSQLEGVVSGVDLYDLREFNKHNKIEDQVDAYALNLYTCMWIISARWPKSIVEVILDKTNDIYKKIPKALNYAEADKYYYNYDYIQINPLNKHLTFKEIIPIQAADLLAWEVRKDDTTTSKIYGEFRFYPKISNHPLRKSLYNLLKSTNINPSVIWNLLLLWSRQDGGYLSMHPNKEENSIVLIKEF
jgi:hypothetical protein